MLFYEPLFLFVYYMDPHTWYNAPGSYGPDFSAGSVHDFGLSVAIGGRTVTSKLEGERKFEEKSGKVGYHRIERSYGSFTRSFSIPATVDGDKVAAEYNNGVLTVSFPKKAVAEARQVKIAVKG